MTLCSFNSTVLQALSFIIDKRYVTLVSVLSYIYILNLLHVFLHGYRYLGDGDTI